MAITALYCEAYGYWGDRAVLGTVRGFCIWELKNWIIQRFCHRRLFCDVLNQCEA